MLYLSIVMIKPQVKPLSTSTTMQIDLKILVNFISEYNQVLIEAPIGGRIDIIYNLLRNYKEQNNGTTSFTFSDFRDLVNNLNDISGRTLQFDSNLEDYTYLQINLNQLPRLKCVNWQRLAILKERLGSLQIREAKFKDSNLFAIEGYKSKYECLITLLNQPLQTRFKEETPGKIETMDLNIDLTTLDNLLKKPNATTSLAQERIALKSKVIPYHEICDEQTHSHILSNICLNKRELAKLNLPDILYIHKCIQQARNQMSPELFKCSQSKIHYLPIMNNHTDLYLGDCSYLDTCHKMKTCRYLHYYSLYPMVKEENRDHQLSKRSYDYEYTIGECYTEHQRKQIPPQWINCDIRHLPFLILGKFAVIVSDPAWDIHMSLPYGTCKDFELLSLPMHELQDEGLILLWVTGRAIEVGRQALQNWGYTISDEMIWIKLNQLKRTIVTGRTGHWLNHSKEHLLVGIKGDPPWINRLMDTDVIVSGTRETLRKPDEVYDIVERIVGTHSRKLEIFGRDHNIRPGWLSKFIIHTPLFNKITNKSKQSEINYWVLLFMKRRYHSDTKII